MAYEILHDSEKGAACVYNTVEDRPIGPVMLGDSAAEQAELFLHYAIRRNTIGMPLASIQWSTWDEWRAEFSARACCAQCGEIAVDESFIFGGPEDASRALDLLGVREDGVAPAIERLCWTCGKKHPNDGRPGPLVDPEWEEEEEG